MYLTQFPWFWNTILALLLNNWLLIVFLLNVYNVLNGSDLDENQLKEAYELGKYAFVSDCAFARSLPANSRATSP